LVNDPFLPLEFELVLAFLKKKSAPGLDQIDFQIICAIPTTIRAILQDIYNDIFFTNDLVTSKP